jgi:hypothetical protein
MQLKPNSTFRMKKSMKWMFQNETDPHRRGELRRMAIQAQLASAIRIKEKKHRNQPDLETS